MTERGAGVLGLLLVAPAAAGVLAFAALLLGLVALAFAPVLAWAALVAAAKRVLPRAEPGCVVRLLFAERWPLHACFVGADLVVTFPYWFPVETARPSPVGEERGLFTPVVRARFGGGRVALRRDLWPYSTVLVYLGRFA